VGVELVDLLLEPRQVLVDVSALGLKRLYDLLNTRQVCSLQRGSRGVSIDVLADPRARATRVAMWEPRAPRQRPRSGPRRYARRRSIPGLLGSERRGTCGGSGQASLWKRSRRMVGPQRRPRTPRSRAAAHPAGEMPARIPGGGVNFRRYKASRGFFESARVWSPSAGRPRRPHGQFPPQLERASSQRGSCSPKRRSRRFP
jgi:hypothetical protein